MKRAVRASTGQGGRENDEGPAIGMRAEPSITCTVIGIPACTVAGSYHMASLCIKYPGEREGERLALTKAPASAGTAIPVRRSREGALLGFFETRARGPGNRESRAQHPGSVTGFKAHGLTGRGGWCVRGAS